MTNKEIISHRLFNHQIADTAFTHPEEIVSYYGAMQAQDWSMVKWALGLRLPNTTEKAIEEKFNAGKILRTHLLRPTWHFVSPKDIRWMQKLTAPRVHQANGLYYRKFDLDAKLFSKTESILNKALQGKNFLTREELNGHFEKAKIKTEGIQLAYIIMHAELECIICSGPRKGKQFTYALLDEILPAAKDLSPEAALKKLTHIYFASRNPATLYDFVWWSGLTVKEARNGIEMLDSNFIKEVIEGQEYIYKLMELPGLKGKQTTFLMPDYDEYGISYKDRSLYHHPKWKKTESLPNADYFHTIAVDGYFGGTWNKKNKGKVLSLEVNPFNSLPATLKKKVEQAATKYKRFFE